MLIYTYLTMSEVLRLFETLDTTTRRVNLPSGRQAVFTDTVGFISDLPTQLIDAFRVSLPLSTNEHQGEAWHILTSVTEHILNDSSPFFAWLCL